MKRFLALLIAIAIAGEVQAQSLCRNEDQTTQYAIEGQCGQMVAGDRYGNQFTVNVDGGGSGLAQSVIPISNATSLSGVGAGNIGWYSVTTDGAETGSTTTVINATGHVVRVGDAIQMYAGTANIGSWSPVKEVTTNTFTLTNALPAAPANGDGFYVLRPVPIYANNASTTSGGSLSVNIDRGYQISAANGLLKAEDAAHTTGDAGVPSLAVMNEGGTTFSSTSLDYIPIGVGRYGDVLTAPVYNANLGETFSAVSREDIVIPNNSVGIKVLGQSNAAIFQAGGDGDANFSALDLGGRTVTTGAPSGEMVVGCNTAVTTATTGQMIAAVASKFTFITSWNCTNTGAAASRVILEDGDGTDLANLLLAATTGNASVNFPTPVKTNAVNKAIQINVITTGTSTICCASGYTGVI